MFFAAGTAAWCTDISSEQSVRDIARKVNEYQKAHPYQEEDRGWIRGTYYTGVMAMYAATSGQEYLDQAMEWGARNQWQVGTDGSGGNKLTCVQTYLQIYMLKKQQVMLQPALDHLNSGGKKTPTGEALWYFEGGRRYSDSLYVGPPALAMLARITGEDRYLDYMNGFFWDVHSELYDADAALFYRDKGYIAGRPAPPLPQRISERYGSRGSTHGPPVERRSSGPVGTVGCSPAWRESSRTCRRTTTCARSTSNFIERWRRRWPRGRGGMGCGA